MAMLQDLSQSQLSFEVAGRGADQFQVVRYRGSEGLCQLYRFEIELAAEPGAIDFATIVGQPAALTARTPAGERWFHGIVARFEMTGETHDLAYFRAELVPSVWLLTHRYNSRIFQQKSVKDIINAVLTAAGIPADRFRFDLLKGTFEPRDYCVQYRETDYNFICRLMEEEGVYWYFEQKEDGHVLVLANDKSAYAPIEGESAALPYHPPTGMNVAAEHVFRFRMAQSVRPGKVVLNDFNFANPKLKLVAESDCGRDKALEFYDAPGEYIEQGRGNALAALRAEEFEAGRTVGVGQSNCGRLTPGRTFELIEHPGGATNQKYMLTAVMHQGKQAVARTTAAFSGRNGLLDARAHQSLTSAQQSDNPVIRDLAEALLQVCTRIKSGDHSAQRALTQWLYHAGQVSRDVSSTAAALGGNPLEALAIPNLMDDISAAGLIDVDAPVYEARFTCVPATVMFRPPRITPWPMMRGTQTALVVGPEGEEIYTDAYGRVKVQFHWDRQGNEGGKPKLHGADSSCWIRVSQGFAGGGYGILFTPRIGQEVIVDFLEGDPDQPIIVGRVYNEDHKPAYLPDGKTRSYIKTRSSTGGGGSHEIRFEDLKGQEQMLLYGEKDLHIRFKNDRVEAIENDRHLLVGNDRVEKIAQNYSLRIGANRNEQIDADLNLAVKGKVSIQTDGTHSATIKGDVVESFKSNHKHEVAQTLAVSAASIQLSASSALELKCGSSSIVLTPTTIFIAGGPFVHINSGTGPPVGPVTASATSPEAPADPLEAETVEHGKDARYEGDAKEPEALAIASLVGRKTPPAEVPPEERTWIEIELVDDDDKPVPGAKYELKLPDGKIRKGTLDANGFARITGVKPGTCEICFPELDAESWERI